MQKFKFAIAFYLFLILSYSSNSQDFDSIKINEKRTTYFRVQYGGNMGFISAGMGKQLLFKRLTVDLNYGYLPKIIGCADVHTVTLKSSVHFLNKEIFNKNTGFYIGSSVIYGITRNTFLKYPGFFPDDYYDTNAFHLLPFLGTWRSIPLKNSKLSAIASFLELGTVDDQILCALNNNDINVSEIWNLSFGIYLILR